MKPLPVTVIAVPPVVSPIVGLTASGAENPKAFEPLCSLPVCTETFTDPSACFGVVNVSLVDETYFVFTAVRPR